MPSISQKRCNKCSIEQPTTAFHRNKRMPDGLSYYCKSCRKIDRHKWYIAHREQLIKQSQEYRINHPEWKAHYDREYARRNRDKIREYKRNYYAGRKLEKRLYDQQYHQTRKVHHAKSMMLWRTRNPDRMRLYKHRHRARQKALPDNLTQEQWQYALNYFNGCCAVCGRPLKDLFGTYTAAMDHWIPLTSLECPGTVAINIVPLCHGENGCNNSKQNRMPNDWLILRYGNRKAKRIMAYIKAYFIHISGNTK